MKIYPTMKFVLLAVVATTSVPYASSLMKNSPENLLLTRDLLVIAKFLV